MTNEDAIRWLDNLKNDIGNPHYERLWHYAQAIDEICYLLKEQQPKKGEWITVTNGRGGNECSLCHNYAPSFQNGMEYLSKYCPECGAKMTK